MQTQAIPSVKYSLPVQTLPSPDGNIVKDELAQKIGLYRTPSITDEQLKKRLMTGEVVFMINDPKREDEIYLVVLTTQLTGRIPTMTFLTQTQTTQLVNKHDSIINQMFIQTGLGNRRDYDHLIVGLPDEPVQGQ